LEHPSKFQRVLRLAFVTAATSLNGSQANLERCLAVSWTGTLYINFRGLLPFNEILPRAKFTLPPSIAFSYIGALLQGTPAAGVRQPNFAAWYKEWNYGTFEEAPPMFGCVGHRLTF